MRGLVKILVVFGLITPGLSALAEDDGVDEFLGGLDRMIDDLSKENARFKKRRPEAESTSKVDTANLGLWAAINTNSQRALKVVWADTKDAAIEKAKDECHQAAGGECSNKGAVIQVRDPYDVFVTACCAVPSTNCSVAVGKTADALQRLRHIFEDNGFSQCSVRAALSAHSGDTAAIDPDEEAILADIPARPDSLQHQIDVLREPLVGGGGNEIAFNQDGSKVFFRGWFRGLGSEDNLMEFDVDTKRARQVFEAPSSSAMDIEPGLDLVGIAVPYDGKIVIRTIKTGAVKRTIDVGSEIRTLSLAPDGKTIAGSATEDREVKIWEVSTGKALRELSTGQYEVKLVSFSPDGKSVAALATADAGRVRSAVFIWDALSGDLVAKLEHDNALLSSFAYSRDGKRLAVTLPLDPEILVWDTASGVLTHDIRGAELDWSGLGFDTLAFSPDGQLIAAAGRNETVYVFDVSTQKAVGQIEPSRNYLTDRGYSRILRLAFSDDGKTLAILNWGERALQLFDTSEFERVRIQSSH